MKYGTIRAFFLLLLLANSINAQKSDVVIKVYLEDACTGKAIKNAKVTLEGFEIPEIVGSYNKKGKFYYFNKIPKGYTTVMAYHQGYNEKGFQCFNSFPESLRLKIYKSENVAYSFEKPHDVYKKKKVEEGKRYYIEDPYKISIAVDSISDYNTAKLYILNKIKIAGIGVELVNPYYENNKIINDIDFTQSEAYPSIPVEGTEEINPEYILPINSGFSNRDILFDQNFTNTFNNVSFIFRKIDGEKFKRYNDPHIQKLRSLKGIEISSIIYNKNAGERGPFDFTDNFIIRDRLNRNLNKKLKIDSSKVFFYNTSLPNKNMNKILRYKLFNKNEGYGITLPDDDIMIPSAPFFILISPSHKIPKNLAKNYDPEYHDVIVPQFESSIGLGILDMYEYLVQ